MLDQYPNPEVDIPLEAAPRNAEAVLAGGCFWCTEAVYEGIPGVIDVESGYAGGDESTANYEAVCRGNTGHAEVIRITYDASKVTYGQLLKAFFFIAHDPTTLNRQGNDVGTQYRSAIFYANDDEYRVASAYIKQIDRYGHYPVPVVTTLEPLERFFVAEKYHQDFARKNPSHPYINAAATPKVMKLRKAMGA